MMKDYAIFSLCVSSIPGAKMIFIFFTYLFIIQTNKQTPSPPKQKTNKNNTPSRQFFDPSDIWIEAPLKCGFQQQQKYFFLVPELKFFSFITQFLT